MPDSHGIGQMSEGSEWISKTPNLARNRPMHHRLQPRSPFCDPSQNPCLTYVLPHFGLLSR